MALLDRRISGFSRATRRAFTLVELLVVMAIIAIIAAITLPVINSVMRPYQLTVTGQTVTNQLVLARQNALGNSHAVQVRFYYLPDFNASMTGTPAVYRGMQCFTESDPTPTGVTLTALTKPVFFPAPVIISSGTVSPLLPTIPTTPTAVAGDFSLPNYQLNYKYAVFRYKPDGSTDLTSVTSSFTLVVENDKVVANGLPANFQTIQIDPMIGSVRSFRP